MKKIFVQNNVCLKNMNGFGLNAQAQRYVCVTQPQQLPQLRDYLCFKRLFKPLILGGGSNLILAQTKYPCAVQLNITGKYRLKTCKTHHYFRIFCGENWHDWVKWSIENNFPGLENLAFIPGKVGAAPIQNIGAYGIELAHFVHQVLIFDLDTGHFKYLSASNCQFSYRHSLFKHQQHWLVIALDLKLPIHWKPALNYPSLAQSFQNIPTTATEIFNVIGQLRASKMPDCTRYGNVGSFFKNPSISAQHLEVLKQQYPKLPTHITTDTQYYKVSAAWLIEQAGWKQKPQPHVGVYSKQALVLINRTGQASAQDLLDFAQCIRQDVWLRFQIELEIEPSIQ